MSAPAIISSGTAAGGPPVGGTGTTNTIPRWTGPSTLGDSGLIDNGTAIYTTTRNVGIGTVSPYTRTESSTARTTALTSIAAFASMPLTVTDTTAFATGVGGGINFRGQLSSSSYTNFAAIWAARETGIPVDYKGSLILATADNVGGYPVERARIDSAGNFAVGRVPTVGTIFETQGDQVTFRDAAGNVRFRFEAANSLLNIGIGSGWGLKLPATPGNTDPNTLDAYRDGGTAGSGGATFTATLKGGTTDPTTPVTATGTYILIGKALIFNIYFASVDTTGASGDVYVTTNLAAALLPAVRTVGSAGAFQFNVSYGGIFADLRTDGKIYVLYNVSNGAWQAAQHTAGTGRNLVLSGVYMIP